MITRKSCKSYLDKHVDKALIRQIVEVGLNAPSGMNTQTPRFIVVSDNETIKRLSRMNADVMKIDCDPFYEAKDVIVVVAKKKVTYLYDFISFYPLFLKSFFYFPFFTFSFFSSFLIPFIGSRHF